MKTKITCGIYQITNLLDNKIYIGHSEDVLKRWKRHKICKGSLLLGNAIKKYGINNFKFEILEEIETIDKTKKDIKVELYQREQYYLDTKKPYIKNVGYNIDKIAKYNNTHNRSEDFKNNIRRINLEGNFTGKTVIQYDLKGVLIKEWKSAAEIERQLSFKAENISACCLGKQYQSNHYIWRFKKTKLKKEDVLKANRHHNLSEVIQYDLNGNKLNRYKSTLEASKISGINYNIIKEACGGHKKTGGGFIWKFRNEPLVLNNHVKEKTPIYQHTINGELIKEWESLNILIKTLGYSYKYIKQCCNGKIKQYNGFVWTTN